MSEQSVDRALGVLIGKVDAIGARLDRADESRAIIHQKLEAVVLRATHLETDLMAVKNKVDGMEKVTVAVTTLRTKAEGAGTLGMWLLKFGGWVLGGASTLAWLYTWLTGRPPP